MVLWFLFLVLRISHCRVCFGHSTPLSLQGYFNGKVLSSSSFPSSLLLNFWNLRTISIFKPQKKPGKLDIPIDPAPIRSIRGGGWGGVGWRLQNKGQKIRIRALPVVEEGPKVVKEGQPGWAQLGVAGRGGQIWHRDRTGLLKPP